MRWDEILKEGPAEDADAHALAHQLRGGIIRHFMNKDLAYDSWGGQNIRSLSGRLCIQFDASLFGWPAPYDTTVFELEANPSPGSPTGFHARYKSSGRDVICIRCVDDPVEDLPNAAHAIVFQSAVHSVLLHEIIHMIDEMQGRKNSDMTGYAKTKGTDAYWNHPTEFNAFFHEFADRLIAFINRSKIKKSPKDILSDAKGNKITHDFWETWRNVLGSAHLPQVKTFLDKLDTRNRHRALSRFYKLHHEACDILDQAKSKIQD